MSRRRTTGSIERDDLASLVDPVTGKFIEMLQVISGRLIPPAMTPITAARYRSNAYLRNVALFWHLAGRETYQLPLVSPVWVQHLIEESVEPKIAVRGIPLTYVLDPHPDQSAAENVEEFRKGVLDYLIDVAEAFAGYQRSWTDDPDAVYMYEQVRKHSLEDLLDGTSVSFPRTLGRFTSKDWQRWYEEGIEEGIEPDVEYLAIRAALYVHGISSMAGGLINMMRTGLTEGDPEALQEPELFRQAVFLQLDEALKTLAGEIPDDDPIRIADAKGKHLRRVFNTAREEAGITVRQANEIADQTIGASYEDRRDPSLAWIPIERGGATNLDLAQRSWLWENRVSGSNLESDLWGAITGEYDWPDWVIPDED